MMHTNLSTLAVLVCVINSAAGQDCLTTNHNDAQDGQGIGACDSYISQGIVSCETDLFFGGGNAGA